MHEKWGRSLFYHNRARALRPEETHLHVLNWEGCAGRCDYVSLEPFSKYLLLSRNSNSRLAETATLEFGLPKSSRLVLLIDHASRRRTRRLD